MTSTARRLGRPIVVDGVKYHWKVRIWDYDYYGDPVYQVAPKVLWLEIRAPFGFRGLSLQLDHRDGEKVAVTPGMVAQHIRNKNPQAHVGS